MVATSAGLALATVSLTAAVQIGEGLPGAGGWLAILVAGGVSLLAAWCFAELVGLFPTAAGIKLFIEKAFGERTALLFAGLYVVVSVLIVGGEAFVLGAVLHQLWPAVPSSLWAILFLSGMAGVNLRGVRLTGWVQDLLTWVMLAGLLGLGLWTLLRPGAPPPPLPFDLGGPGAFMQAIALAVFLFLGFEWVVGLAEEVRDVRVLPRGMAWALLLLTATYALFHVALMTGVDRSVLAGSATPHLLLGQAVLGRVGLIGVGSLSALASATSFNAGLLTASRFLYALGRDGAAPPVVARLHERWATPWVAILLLYALCAGMAILLFWTGGLSVIIYLGAAVECLIFCAMAAALLRLRRTMATAVRPFRAPGGALIPVAVIGIYGVLLLLLFLPQGGWEAQGRALLLLAVLGLVVGGYTLVLPRLRAKWGRPAGRPRRRPPKVG
ncbi:MAG TPA: APC family permease [Symbiobacteriaceae bacterium]|nr:APC family permease [Symbiobacteriaceae bacterium]